MEYIYSPMKKQAYLDALKRKFENPLNFWDERVTGFVLGPFFAVAHYQEYEWNRRITSECNRAYGIVRENPVELEICFFRGKGILAPSWLLIWTVILRLWFLFLEIQVGESFGMVTWISSAAISLVICLISAFHSSITEKGEAGAWEIYKLLKDPENYYC